jgi:hypothetical protein
VAVGGVAGGKVTSEAGGREEEGSEVKGDDGRGSPLVLAVKQSHLFHLKLIS